MHTQDPQTQEAAHLHESPLVFLGFQRSGFIPESL